MKDNMKKIYLFLLAAAGILAVASCAREELVDKSDVAAPEEVTTFTFGFDATKTALVGGKTTWEAGDVIRVFTSNAGFYRDVTVPDEAVGQSSFSADVNIKDTLYYAVYPIEACTSVSGGKINVTLPTSPDGRFASANICVASTKGSDFQMKNATAVLKINVTSGNVVEILQINAKNTMVGNLAVGFGADTLNYTVSSPSKSVTIAVGGIDGDYYIPVVPGTYEKDFAVTALRGNGGYQTLKTTVDNEVKLNQLFNLGTIGNNLSAGLTGEGTEDKPFVVSNLGEWTAFQASVNLGKPYTGEFVSLETDITEAVIKPVSYYVSDDTQFPFNGIFKGNNRTIKVDIDGENCESADEIALFANIGPGAVIQDLTVEGKVTSTGVDVGGIVGWAHGNASSMITLKNLTNKAVISTSNVCSGGVAAYVYYTNIENCKNEGTVTSTATAGSGMYFPAGNNYSASNYNSGNGGVVGWAQNSNIKDCSNTAAITGFNKVGGVAGTTYWTNVDNATNSADITGTGYYEGNNIGSQMQCTFGSAAGGVIGWVHTSGNIKNCSNSGNIVGKTGIGGVVGFANSSQSATPTFENMLNTGKVTSNVEGTGKSHPRGIAGFNAGTGGVFGTVMNHGARQTKVIIAKNTGDVFSPTVNTGGVIGLLADHGNATKPSYKIIDQCVNEGNVTGGPYWVGGIIGYCFSRYVGRQTIRNCVNRGKVTGTRESGNGTVAGGILGGIGANVATYNTESYDHLQIYNCYNEGEVVYSSTSLTVPYVGGIAGNLPIKAGAFQNNYNYGFVGRADHAELPAAVLGYVGELVGRQDANLVHYSYYPKTNVGPVGTNGTAARTDTVIDYDTDGNLSANVTANGKSCSKLIDALNEWQNYYVGAGNVYFNWTGAANHPVHDTTMN